MRTFSLDGESASMIVAHEEPWSPWIVLCVSWIESLMLYWKMWELGELKGHSDEYI